MKYGKSDTEWQTSIQDMILSELLDYLRKREESFTLYSIRAGKHISARQEASMQSVLTVSGPMDTTGMHGLSAFHLRLNNTFCLISSSLASPSLVFYEQPTNLSLSSLCGML